MLRRSWMLLCAVCLVSSAAQAQVKLEWKLTENSTSTVENTLRLEQKLVIAGQNQESSAENRRTVTAKTGARDGLGRLKIEERIDEMYVKSRAAGFEYEFDSKNPDAKGSSPLEAARPIHKAILQQAITKIHDKDNTLAEIEFDQQFLNTLEPAVQAQVKDQVSPDTIKKEAKQSIARLPTRPVAVGDTWEHTDATNLGAGQILTVNSRYKYEGTIQKEGKTLDKLTYEVLSTSFGLENSPLPLQVKASDLKPEKSSGVILFDREAGNIFESTDTLHIVGKLTFEINNMTLPAELDLKMESSMIRKK